MDDITIKCVRCTNNVPVSDTRDTKHGAMCLDCISEHIDYTNVLGWCSDCYYQFIDELHAIWEEYQNEQ